jgi:hypothetical protein
MASYVSPLGNAAEAVLRGLGQILAVIVAVVVFAVFLGLLLSIPAALIFAIYKAFPDEIAQSNDSGWVELIVFNQYVVFAIRIVLISLALVLLFAGVYVTVSILMRMWRREWLHFARGIRWSAVRSRSASGTLAAP